MTGDRSLPTISGRNLVVAVTLLLLSACAERKESVTTEQATVDFDILLTLPEQPVSFDQTVKPILDQRCVVCHGCYDAPCQLKLSSPEGLTRGASKRRVYTSSR